MRRCQSAARAPRPAFSSRRKGGGAKVTAAARSTVVSTPSSEKKPVFSQHGRVALLGRGLKRRAIGICNRESRTFPPAKPRLCGGGRGLNPTVWKAVFSSGPVCTHPSRRVAGCLLAAAALWAARWTRPLPWLRQGRLRVVKRGGGQRAARLMEMLSEKHLPVLT